MKMQGCWRKTALRHYSEPGLSALVLLNNLFQNLSSGLFSKDFTSAWRKGAGLK
jgi:hypothetical protein